jgi:hypothetical protein
MIGHPDLDPWWCVGAAPPDGASVAVLREACGAMDDGAVDLLEIGRR